MVLSSRFDNVAAPLYGYWYFCVANLSCMNVMFITNKLLNFRCMAIGISLWQIFLA